MSKKIEFPHDFLWGGATAAEQTEGHGNTGKGETVWDAFFKAKPELFWNQVGPNKTNDFVNRYRDDLKLYKTFNVNSIRLGVSWSRILPDGKNISEKGLQYYRDLIKEANTLGYTIILNIFHFDMPLWAFNKGDWASREVIDSFVKFADLVFEEFADKVDYIATFNEPGVPVLNGYLGEVHWPSIKDNKKAFEVGFGIILAHAKVVDLFRKKYSNSKAKIGAVINVAPPIIKDEKTYTKDDEYATWLHSLLHNEFWLLPMVKGEWPEGGVEFAKKHNVVPHHTQEELDIIKRVKLDFLGTNYYQPSRCVASHNPNPECFMDEIKHYKYDKARYNVFRGWEIRPETLYELSMRIKNEFNNIPFYISENGMGVEGEDQFRNLENGEIQDDYRIAFLQEHLVQLNKAIQEGANCFGYHMWAISDNWSWRNAYKNTYGFVEVNTKTMERKLKKSAHWFAQTIKDNGFMDGFKTIEETIDLSKVKYTESV